MKKIVIICFLITVSFLKTFAQQPEIITSDKQGWHKIGETKVDLKKELDEIVVLGNDRFEFIKIKVEDMPINLVSFEIYFETGEKQVVQIGSEIKSPGETRTVKLEGGERSLKKVTFVYKTMPNSGDKKAQVELWGLKSGKKKNKSK